VGQLANMISGWPQGAFPSNTKNNPLYQVKAIMLRSEKQIKQPSDFVDHDYQAIEKEMKACTGQEKHMGLTKKTDSQPEIYSRPPYVQPVPFPQWL